MQKNYYACDIFEKSPVSEGMSVVFPVNGDDSRYLAISRSNIRKLKPEEKILQFDFPEYTTNRAVCSNKGYTDGICDCIVVLLYNDNKAYMYHLNSINYTNEEDFKQMQKAFENSISDLGKCQAFLYGGIRYASDELYENITKVLDDNDIKRQEAVFSVDNHIAHSMYFDVKKGIILSDEVYAYHSKQQLEENFERVNLNNYFYSEII